MKKKKDNKNNRRTIIVLLIIAIILIVLNVIASLFIIDTEWKNFGWGGIMPICENTFYIFYQIYNKRYQIGRIISILYFLIVIIRLFISKVDNKIYFIIKGLLISICIFEFIKLVGYVSYMVYEHSVSTCIYNIEKNS